MKIELREHLVNKWHTRFVGSWDEDPPEGIALHCFTGETYSTLLKYVVDAIYDDYKEKYKEVPKIGFLRMIRTQGTTTQSTSINLWWIYERDYRGRTVKKYRTE